MLKMNEHILPFTSLLHKGLLKGHNFYLDILIFVITTNWACCPTQFLALCSNNLWDEQFDNVSLLIRRCSMFNLC